MPAIPVFPPIKVVEKTPLLSQERKMHRSKTYGGESLSNLWPPKGDQDNLKQGYGTTGESVPSSGMPRTYSFSSNLCAIPEVDEERRKSRPSGTFDSKLTGSINSLDEEVESTRIRWPWRDHGGVVKLITLLTISVISLTAVVVSMPLCINSVIQHGGDAYIATAALVTWFPFGLLVLTLIVKVINKEKLDLTPTVPFKFMILYSALLAVGILLITSMSWPIRTPPFLQPVLLTTVFSFAVTLRPVCLGTGIHGPVLGCIAFQVLGVFVALIPEIFSLPNSVPQPDREDDEVSWLGVVIILLGTVPLAGAINLMHKLKESHQFDVRVFLLWTHLLTLLMVILMFWINFIPKFGMISSLDEYRDNLAAGLPCFYGDGKGCMEIQYRAAILIIAYCIGITCFSVLTELPSCTPYHVYSVVAIAMPIATLFWAFFTDSPFFHWRLLLGNQTICCMIGVLVTSGAVMVFAKLDKASPPVVQSRFGRRGRSRTTSTNASFSITFGPRMPIPIRKERRKSAPSAMSF